MFKLSRTVAATHLQQVQSFGATELNGEDLTLRTHVAELSVTFSHTQSHNLTLAEEEEDENLSADIIVAPKDYIAAVAHETQLFVETIWISMATCHRCLMFALCVRSSRRDAETESTTACRSCGVSSPAPLRSR